MHVIDEMKSYVGFDEADTARLRAFWPHVKPRLDEVVDRFYERILAHPRAEAVLEGADQVTRLKCTLRTWLEELLTGPHDRDYYRRRRRIGHVHVRVGLPARFMTAAMSGVRAHLCEIAREVEGDDEAAALCRSIGRATDLDLASMTAAYMEAREERQLAALNDLIVAHMPVAVFLVDREGRVTSWTRSAERLFQGPWSEESPLVDVLPGSLVEAAGLAEQLRHTSERREPVSLLRVDTTVDGEDRSFRIDVVPLDHTRARLLLHIEELTEALETEARLQRSEALAQLGALSASVAHELRNPLAGISAAVQVVGNSLDEGDHRREVLDHVGEQIRRLDTLVDDLLAFARPGVSHLDTVDLRKSVRSVVSLVAPDHPAITIAIEGEGSAHADTHGVHRILLNLLKNACQAMEGTGRILIQIEQGTVRVHDSGPGVSGKVRERIFAPFFTTRHRGTGLGLAISRRTARNMGAELLLLDQAALEGAAFELRMPVDASDG